MREASQPVNMNAPRMSIQLKPSMKRAICPRETGLEQPELHQDEAEDAPHQMGIGAHDENAAAVDPDPGKAALLLGKLAMVSSSSSDS